jgi:hypothetical protein
MTRVVTSRLQAPATAAEGVRARGACDRHYRPQGAAQGVIAHRRIRCSIGHTRDPEGTASVSQGSSGESPEKPVPVQLSLPTNDDRKSAIPTAAKAPAPPARQPSSRAEARKAIRRRA